MRDPSVVGDGIEGIVRELLAREGDTPTLTSNILRNWSQDKIFRFVEHLLGSNVENLAKKVLALHKETQQEEAAP